MNTYMVKLNSQQDVINFVNMMGKTGCNADIKCGSIVVDACSILGDPGSDFEQSIKQYRAA